MVICLEEGKGYAPPFGIPNTGYILGLFQIGQYSGCDMLTPPGGRVQGGSHLLILLEGPYTKKSWQTGKNTRRQHLSWHLKRGNNKKIPTIYCLLGCGPRVNHTNNRRFTFHINSINMENLLSYGNAGISLNYISHWWNFQWTRLHFSSTLLLKLVYQNL